MPSLLIKPRRLKAPIAGQLVRINRNHRLGQGVVCYIAPSTANGLQDITGLRAPFTRNGSPGFAGTSMGPALSLDGSTQYLSGSDTGLPSGSADRAISVWFSVRGTTGVRAIWTYGTAGSSSYVMAYLSGTAMVVGNSSNFLTGGTVNDTKLHHLVASLTGTNAWSGFLDGVALTNSGGTPSTILSGATGLRLGNYLTNIDYLDGTADNFIVYNRALATDEMRQLYFEPFAALEPVQRCRLAAAATGVISASTGTATGTSAASGGGAALSKGAGTATGTSATAGTGAAKAAARGTATGTSATTAVAKAAAAARGNAAGSAAVVGTGAAKAAARGTATGVGTANGVGAGVTITPAVGTAIGASAALGVGAASIVANGTATGASAASGRGAALGKGVGIATGAATALGVGARIAVQFTPTAGAATGTSTAHGVGASIAQTTGVASGTSAAHGAVYLRPRQRLAKPPLPLMPPNINERRVYLVGRPGKPVEPQLLRMVGKPLAE